VYAVTPRDELAPTFDLAINVRLDGDDDSTRSTENVRTLLEGALREMQEWGAIRGWTLEVRA
jgi:hypothetical protein